MTHKIGLGGGCHWCTEAVFLSLKGVTAVEQGWLSPEGNEDYFSEGIIVHYDPAEITPEVLIEIHIHTHSAASQHAMRHKYRSAIYIFSGAERGMAVAALQVLQPAFKKQLVTQVLPFGRFRLNKEEQLNYYYTDPSRPFCSTYINPKIKLLLERFGKHVDDTKVKPEHLP